MVFISGYSSAFNPFIQTFRTVSISELKTLCKYEGHLYILDILYTLVILLYKRKRKYT